MGQSSVELSGGGCSAAQSFDVPAHWFPEADCVATDDPAESETDSEYAAAVAAAEPMSYWRFEEADGSETSNEAGAAGSLENDVQLGQPGFRDGSRSALLVENAMPGDIGGWIDIPDLELAADFTIEAWYRFCGEFMWFQDAIVGQGEEGPDINFFEWRARLWTGESDVVISENVIENSGWHHLVVTRQGEAVALYEDGVLAGTGTFDGMYPIKTIGNGNAGTFGGWLDEVAIYEQALPADQIAEHAAFGD
jgi:hypothetical protein